MIVPDNAADLAKINPVGPQVPLGIEANFLVFLSNAQAAGYVLPVYTRRGQADEVSLLGLGQPFEGAMLFNHVLQVGVLQEVIVEGLDYCISLFDKDLLFSLHKAEFSLAEGQET
ncbi:hypothetical protein MOOR_28440 [Moorella thermoacetica]|uniref:Uncharacterized protein n=1 Tax=Neomoorella thermoacetica TaxID=1525 RepID=A0A1J5JDF5_NEOTH|nr:hypothetical protein MOOR_28440 [Moorella thermoacetica]